jgi:hypothetical protein
MRNRRSHWSLLPAPLRRPAFWGALAALLATAGTALAAGGGKPATKLVNVVDTRGMSPGFVKWLSDLYNSNLWLFGLVVVVVMAAMGAGLGLLFDRGVALLGINLGKLDHHE